MTTRATLYLILILTILLVSVGLVLRERLPETVATHWNFAGEADGFGSRSTGIYLLPGVLFVVGLLLIALPSIDPRRKNIQEFRSTYNGFILAMAIFLGYLHVLTLIWNLGKPFNFNLYIVPAVGIFLFLAGNLVSKARRNYFIGIRTPWTLADDMTWQKTHQLGGWLFRAAGLITLLGLFFPSQAFILLLASVLGATLISIIASYFIYARLKPEGED